MFMDVIIVVVGVKVVIVVVGVIIINIVVEEFCDTKNIERKWKRTQSFELQLLEEEIEQLYEEVNGFTSLL